MRSARLDASQARGGKTRCIPSTSCLHESRLLLPRRLQLASSARLSSVRSGLRRGPAASILACAASPSMAMARPRFTAPRGLSASVIAEKSTTAVSARHGGARAIVGLCARQERHQERSLCARAEHWIARGGGPRAWWKPIPAHLASRACHGWPAAFPPQPLGLGRAAGSHRGLKEDPELSRDGAARGHERTHTYTHGSGSGRPHLVYLVLQVFRQPCAVIDLRLASLATLATLLSLTLRRRLIPSCWVAGTPAPQRDTVTHAHSPCASSSG